MVLRAELVTKFGVHRISLTSCFRCPLQSQPTREAWMQATRKKIYNTCNDWTTYVVRYFDDICRPTWPGLLCIAGAIWNRAGGNTNESTYKDDGPSHSQPRIRCR